MDSTASSHAERPPAEAREELPVEGEHQRHAFDAAAADDDDEDDEDDDEDDDDDDAQDDAKEMEGEGAEAALHVVGHEAENGENGDVESAAPMSETAAAIVDAAATSIVAYPASSSEFECTPQSHPRPTRQLDYIVAPDSTPWPTNCEGRDELCQVVRKTAIDREVLVAVWWGWWIALCFSKP